MRLIKTDYFKSTFLVFLFASCFIFARCKKEHLPEYYFKCKVDGQSYEPDNCANCLTRDMYGDTIMLLGASQGNETLGLGFMKHNLQTGSYNLSKNITETMGTGSFDNTLFNPSDIFRTDSLRTGQVVVSTLDKTNKIIEGTFYYDAYNIVQDKIVKITDGKFRLQYKAY